MCGQQRTEDGCAFLDVDPGQELHDAGQIVISGKKDKLAAAVDAGIAISIDGSPAYISGKDDSGMDVFVWRGVVQENYIIHSDKQIEPDGNKPYVTYDDRCTTINESAKDSQWASAAAVYKAVEEAKKKIPTKVSAFDNDAGYQTAEDVQNAVPTKISAFTNDAGYLTADDVPSQIFNVRTDDSTGTVNCTFDELKTALNDRSVFVTVDGYPIASGVAEKYDSSFSVTGFTMPVIGGEFIRSITILNDGTFTWGNRDEMIFKSDTATEIKASDNNKYPTGQAVYNAIEAAKNAIEEADTSCLFYVPFAFGATGFALDGVTHAEILAAYNAGKRIIAKGYVPEAAGLGAWGEFNIPMTCLQDNSTFTLAFLSGTTSVEVFVASDNSVSYNINVLQNMESRVTSITSSATHSSYPTAKAVYDAIQSAQAGSGTGDFPYTVVTKLDSTATDDQIPTAKAVRYNLDYVLYQLDNRPSYFAFGVVCYSGTPELSSVTFEDIYGRLSSDQNMCAEVTIMEGAIPGINEAVVCFARLAYATADFDFLSFTFFCKGKWYEMKVHDDDSVTITEVTSGTAQ